MSSVCASIKGESSNSRAVGEATALPLKAKDENDILPVCRFPPLSVFEQSTTYPAIIVPVRRTAELRNTLSSVLLHRPKTKNVYPCSEDATMRKLIFSKKEAWQEQIVQSLLSQGCSKGEQTITLTYADMTVEEVLRQVLPSTISEMPSAFEIVGNIAHVNLREDVLPYKFIVGKTLLDKNAPRIKTVVNKLGSIANEYRTFGMEVIAGFDGPDWSLVTVKEEGFQFTLDFQQVYWNSRLGAEHRRLVQLIQKDARRKKKKIVVADLMAGVGPFAVPLTGELPVKGNKKSKATKYHDYASKIVVYANDLNPASSKYLKINAEKNKCPHERLHCYNMDARAFCHLLQESQKDSGIPPVEFDHVIMNLPATAPEFLDAFRGFTNTTLPRIHVYCFAPKLVEQQSSASQSCGAGDVAVDGAVLKRCCTALGCSLDPAKHHASIRIVRDVSPSKNMVCVSFDLPGKVRELPRIAIPQRNASKEAIEQDSEADVVSGDSEPEPKRCKISN
jgi:tRNA (guanine37-N1)-methyltransferase